VHSTAIHSSPTRRSSDLSECGGIGAVWDNTDYEAMAADWDKDDSATPAAHTCAPADERATSCSPSCFWGDCPPCVEARAAQGAGNRKSTRLNSSHVAISY